LQGLAACPWCDIESKSTFRLFNIVVTGTWQPGGSVDVEAVWRRILAVVPPGPLPLVATPLVTASNEVQVIARQRQVSFVGIWMTAFTVFIGATFAVPNSLFIWLLGVLIVAGIATSIGGAAADAAKKEAQTRLTTARAQLHTLAERWKREAGPERFLAARQELEAKKREHAALADERVRQLRKLEADRETRQRERFLDRFQVSSANIRGIGPSRTATLESYGVETAADIVAQKVEQIPGFGPALVTELLAWRRTVERKFVFDPKKGVDPADVAAIENSIARKRAQLEADLKQGATTLEQLSKQIQGQRAALRPFLEAAVKAVAQAEADLKAL
jgi:DNA-binding helix-hairpin-helix protein with protein kinase domain